MKNIFISYAKEDIEVAGRIYDDLRKAGLNPWFDRESLLPGQRWKSEIHKAIRNCRYFLALLSTQSVTKKGYVQKEIKEAIDVLDEFPESTVFIIPARINECSPSHERLHDLHWVDLFPSYEDGLAKILRVFEVTAVYEQISEPVSALDQIFSLHSRRGQLSQAKIGRAVSVLPQGSYLLLVATKKPPHTRQRNTIAQHVFRRATWKGGMWRIVPLSNFYLHARHHPYVSFFNFVVPKAAQNEASASGE